MKQLSEKSIFFVYFCPMCNFLIEVPWDSVPDQFFQIFPLRSFHIFLKTSEKENRGPHPS